jgi:hypothetical protein
MWGSAKETERAEARALLEAVPGAGEPGPGAAGRGGVVERDQSAAGDDAAAFDQAKSLDIYKQADRILVEEVSIVPLYYLRKYFC